MVIDTRKHKRYLAKLMVKVKTPSFSTWGVLRDVSEGGLFVQTKKKIATGTIIDMELVLPDKTISSVKGIVKRTMKIAGSNRECGMGIELIEKDTMYVNFVKALTKRKKG
jgi:Tfp pilus assembly protein PilZ